MLYGAGAVDFLGGIKMRIVDLHCDTVHELNKLRVRGEHYNLYKSHGHLDVEHMHQGGYMVQCFALFVHMKEVVSPYVQGKTLVDLYKRLCAEYSPYIAPVYHFSDIEEHAKKGLVSGILTIEEGGVLEGSLEKLQEFYEYGVRMITLTWNFPNEIGFPGCLEERALPEVTNWKVLGAYPGLTPKGIEIVQTMEEQGIIVDVSHLSDAGFWDVAALTGKPFVASHSNARSICGHKRNLSDAQIRTLGERGGVMGLNYEPQFLENNPEELSWDSFMRHIKHIINVGGEEVLALGSDFDGIDLNPLLPHAGAVPRLFEVMEQHGIAPSVIDKMSSKNALRVMKEVIR